MNTKRSVAVVLLGSLIGAAGCRPRTSKPTPDDETSSSTESGGANAGGQQTEPTMPLLPNAGAGGTAAGAGGEPGAMGGGVAEPGPVGGAGPPPEEPDAGESLRHGPPVVGGASPSDGPWGAEVTIDGTDLGSDGREDVFLTIGADALIEPDDEEVVSWTERRIVVRVPFPHSGALTVETPEGSAGAGTFPAPYAFSPVFSVELGTSVLASVSLEVGKLALLLDTDPLTIAEFDGAEWQSHTLPDADILPETARLYGDDATLKAFALSTTATPEIVDFAQVGDDWVATPSAVSVTAQHALAGGPNGAVVWFANADQWSRARVGASGWSVDNGPIADPTPGETMRAAGATSDGSLYLARPRDTTFLLDELGAPFVTQLPAGGSDFDTEFRAGASVDDYVTSVKLVDRGRGVLIEYCGSDTDPFGVTGTEMLCYTSALTSAGLSLLSSSNENEFRSYHAATANKWLVGTCNSAAGSVLAEGEDATVAQYLTWPCTEFGAVEIDPEGNPVVSIRYDGGLTVLVEP